MDDTQRKAIRMLGFELDGVLADVKHSAQGFDAVCLETVERVRASLAALAAAPQSSALPEPSEWQKNKAFWQTQLDRLAASPQPTEPKPVHSAVGGLSGDLQAQPDERQRFETFVRQEMGDVAVMDRDRYISPKIQKYWLTWQAAIGGAQ
jgi:hypothetical protein